MDDLLEQFLIEGRELVEQASNDLVALEHDPSDAARLDSVFRAVHTLKGSVGLFDFAPMGVTLHAAEDLLGTLRSKKAAVNRSMIDALLECIDATERWIEAIASAGRLPASAEREGQSLSETLTAALQTTASPGETVSGANRGDALPATFVSVPAGDGKADDNVARIVRVDAARIELAGRSGRRADRH